MSVAIPEGSLALDSSVLIELLSGTELGARISNEIVVRPIVAYTSYVNVAEAEYVLCRKLGHSHGRSRVEDLLSSEIISIRDDPALHAACAEFKCQRAISLPDCYTFAVAEVTSSTPVFLSKEKELLNEIKMRPFKFEPLFLT